jgi:hypothetical protein
MVPAVVLKHRFAAIAEARRLDCRHLQAAAQLVDDQRRQGFALDVLGDHEQRLAGLDDGLEDWEQVLAQAQLGCRFRGHERYEEKGRLTPHRRTYLNNSDSGSCAACCWSHSNSKRPSTSIELVQRELRPFASRRRRVPREPYPSLSANVMVWAPHQNPASKGGAKMVVVGQPV